MHLMYEFAECNESDFYLWGQLFIQHSLSALKFILFLLLLKFIYFINAYKKAACIRQTSDIFERERHFTTRRIQAFTSYNVNQLHIIGVQT